MPKGVDKANIQRRIKETLEKLDKISMEGGKVLRTDPLMVRLQSLRDQLAKHKKSKPMAESVIVEGKHPANCTCKVCEAHEADTKKKGMGFAAKKGTTGKGKVGKGVKLAESVNILNFVKSLTEKNYAAANKYLQTAVREKIKSRIAQCADIKPF